MSDSASMRARPWGTRVECSAGRPIRVVDRTGVEMCALRWRGDELEHARLRLPDGRAVEIEACGARHPLFGPVDRVWLEGEATPRANLAAVRWSAPTSIPPLDRPAALPAGAGTAILNLLARRCVDAGIETLRYCGPYPTTALFETLQSSYRVAGDPVHAAARFSQADELWALRGQMREVEVDFAPAPHEWFFSHPRICLQARTTIERLYVDGRGYTRQSTSPTRLRDDGDELVAGLEIAGRWWADIARVDRHGKLIDGPHPLPRARSALLGMELPPSVVEVLAEAIGARAPTLMQATLRRQLASATFRFEDTGDVLARRDARGIQIHVLLGERLDALEPHAQLGWLLVAVEPIARRWAQEELAAADAAPLR